MRLNLNLSQGGYKINFSHNGLEFDESLVNLDVKMKGIDERTVVNVKSEVFDDIDDPIVVHISDYEWINNEFQHLANVSLNVCNVMTRVKAHPILKIVLQELLKASNIPTSCPIKRGPYYMKDFILNEDLLPPFLPLGKFMGRIRVVRMVNEDEVPLVKMNVVIEIDNAKERKSFKLF